ncbi:MAG: Dabb family protein [Candidatus Dormibacteraeota bacterium]|nr:Dabb family protein [Candidatus Dormibacteraeota bacterium]MBV9526411.1 Dabb family protein [Candidatus Dormibacteraeota bacterium]
MTLQHIVLFSFPRELSDAEYEDMRSQIAAWPEKIGGFSSLRFGADITGARTRGYSRLLYMEFDGTDELQRYRAHPVHQAFNQWIIDHECTPLAFDYFLDERTVLMPEAGVAGALREGGKA